MQVQIRGLSKNRAMKDHEDKIGSLDACDAIDKDKIEESLNRCNIDERDDFATQTEQGEEIEVETGMKKMVRAAKMMACGSSLPLSVSAE